MEVPVIETPRLRLRGHRKDDFEAALGMWTDPLVVRFIGGKPSTPQQVWSRILGYMGHWQAMKYGYWVIEEKAGGTFIGEIGFADFKRDIAPSMRDVPEIGFALVSSRHGKGYASEAVRAVLEWGGEHLPSKRTVALVNVENAPSVRILERSGYAVFERTTFNDAPVFFMEHAN